jgi:poly(3-hydroxybutyrate) depolymerase
LYIPPTYSKDKPSPLLVMFHPAGKGATDALELLDQAQPLLDRTRTIVLVPESRGATWDVVMSG